MAKIGKAKFLEPAETAALLAGLDWNKYPERDRVAVLLSLKAGLRVSEIAGLTWCNVTTADGKRIADLLDVPAPITKGKRAMTSGKSYKRARTVTMHPDLKDALLALWIEHPNHVAADLPLIWSERGERYGANGLSRQFLKWFAAAGLEGCSSHSGRRTLLTRLARTCEQHGGSLEDVRQIAGHSDIRATQVYLSGSSQAQSNMMVV